mmetsp:Transcript_89058/g.229796  ORF Transcript_89058/g.229796 Transcript_89058/m.229796 type:complete len:315 (-) Transcript_89058:9-953(-)
MGAQTSCGTDALLVPERLASTCVDKVGGDCYHDQKFDRKLVNVQLLAGARDGEEQIVREALRAGAYLETRQPMRIVVSGRLPAGSPGSKGSKGSRGGKAKGKMGPTPLMLAAKSGSVGCVKALLDAGAKVRSREEDSMRPVHFAALGGEFEVLKLLLARGADAAARDANKCSVLDHLPEEVQRHKPELRKWMAAVQEAQEAADRHAADEAAGHSSLQKGSSLDSADSPQDWPDLDTDVSDTEGAAPLEGSVGPEPRAGASPVSAKASAAAAAVAAAASPVSTRAPSSISGQRTPSSTSPTALSGAFGSSHVRKV